MEGIGEVSGDGYLELERSDEDFCIPEKKESTVLQYFESTIAPAVATFWVACLGCGCLKRRKQPWEFSEAIKIDEEVEVPKKSFQKLKNNTRNIEQAKRNITDLLGSMANDSYYSLHNKKSKLRNLGVQIDYLHPLVFLEITLTDQVLTKYMSEIKRRYIPLFGFMVWDNFLNGENKNDGFLQKLWKTHVQKEVTPYLKGFCDAIGKRDFEGQIKMLLTNGQLEAIVKLLYNL